MDRKQLIRSRVRMPDGAIIQGYQGQKILDERRRRQEKMKKITEKLERNYSPQEIQKMAREGRLPRP